MGRRPTGRDVSSAAAPPSIPTRGIDHGCEPSRAGARCSCARRARRGPLIGRTGSTGVRRVAARGCPPCLARSCAGSAAMCWFHERALSSAGERRPYKAEVVGSIPTAPTDELASLRRPGSSHADRDRDERDRPAELVHVDVKKLARISRGGGHRIHGADGFAEQPRMGDYNLEECSRFSYT
jgi:hypothetical protein